MRRAVGATPLLQKRRSAILQLLLAELVSSLPSFAYFTDKTVKRSEYYRTEFER
jgi:hypothetical protein